MITKIRYKNFKALRNTTLPLGRFTLIVGANGTGKSTAMQALAKIDHLNSNVIENYLSNEASLLNDSIVIEVFWNDFSLRKNVNVQAEKQTEYQFIDKSGEMLCGSKESFIDTLTFTTDQFRIESEAIDSFELFSFDSEIIAMPVYIKKNITLGKDGKNLAGILLQIQTSEDEVFEKLNNELQNWFSEFDRIVFEFPEDGQVSFLLRTKIGKHKIKAKDLSDGTRLALAYLTLAYLPNPPKIIAFEEPEKGIHPRLLENIQEAMYRLAYPENYGEDREPVQVIATTHSPYLLDLYKEHPEEIVISSKDEKGVHFERLIDKPHYEEVIKDAPLGDIWYSGILGGVPIQP